jgi:hypothetical protein
MGGQEMARISYVDRNNASSEVRETFDEIEGAFGVLPNFFKAMAHSPLGMKTVWDFFSRVIPGWKCDPKLLELVYIRTCQLNGCHY